jgi:hypothetical protein
MRAAPFPYALALAFGAHAAGAFAFVSAVRPRAPAPAEQTLTIEIVDEPSEPAFPPPRASDETTPAPAPASLARAATAPGGTRDRPAPESAEQPLAEVTSDVPQPASSAGTWSLGATDLGVGTYWRTAASAQPVHGEGATEPPENGHAPSAIQMIQAELAARDRELGLSRASPLVSAAHEAASPSIAPDEGSATFEIESDETGKVVSAKLVSFGGDTSAWNDVGRAIVTAMAPDSKRLRLPRGARGLRARLQITAERVLPSGEHHTYTAGAVPDDVAGGGSACVPNGTTRKCISGSPAGASGTLGDLSNIGQKRSRVVHVQLLGESAF